MAQPSDPKIKLIRGAGTLVAALLLAWMTHSAVGEQSVQDYLTQQWPNPDMWQGYLSHQGYQLVRDPQLQSRLLQKFVPVFDNAPAVFTSDDDCLIYFEATPHLNGQSQLWSCAIQPPSPRRWLKIGTGWAAFEKVPKSPRNEPKPSNKLSNSIDPKEIRY